MPSSPLPSGALKRPPLLQHNSSNSSLSGLEQSIPSFRDFVTRTPSLDETKPLPPTPLIPRRSISTATGSSQPSTHNARRSSSIYSRTPSQWMDDVPPRQSIDLLENPLPTLQPIAYSRSTPQLSQQQPRAFEPLIAEPSPTVSRSSTPSPSPSDGRPSVLLPIPLAKVNIPKKHLRTVSLEKAKEAMFAPGVVHLLPEELRAQSTRTGLDVPGAGTSMPRSKSQEPVRLSSIDILGNNQCGLPPNTAPTLVDSQGRDRLAVTSGSKRMSTDLHRNARPEHVFTQVQNQAVTTKPQQIPQARHDRTASLQAQDESRGRTRQRRAPPIAKYAFVAQTKSNTEDSSEEEEVTRQKIASTYRPMGQDPYRQQSYSPGTRATDSDNSDEVRVHMKMIPQALFHGLKPPAGVPGTVSGKHDSAHSAGNFNYSSQTSESGPSPGRSSGNFPLRLSLSPGPGHRRRSTSGSIPISPPSFIAPPQTRGNPSLRGSNKPGSRKASAEADIIAQVLQGPMTFAQSTARVESAPKVSHRPLRSNASSDKSSKPKYQRLADKTTYFAERLTRPFNSSDAPDDEEAPRPSASSPHLLPSPTNDSKVPTVYLGWSDKAKSTFDTMRSSAPSQKNHRPVFEHIVAPAKPLDGRTEGLAEPESPTRRPSLFGSVLDGWRESKANKRREDLKKSIKVVQQAPVEEAGSSVGRRGSILQGFSSPSWRLG